MISHSLKVGAVRDAVRAGELWVNPNLASALDEFKYPLCFMDFETINPALPPTRAHADAADGHRNTLSQAQHLQARAGRQNVSLPAARPLDHPVQSSLAHGHHLQYTQPAHLG